MPSSPDTQNGFYRKGKWTGWTLGGVIVFLFAGTLFFLLSLSLSSSDKSVVRQTLLLCEFNLGVHIWVSGSTRLAGEAPQDQIQP